MNVATHKRTRTEYVVVVDGTRTRTLPEYVIIEEMDGALRRSEDAMRTHDRWAFELGFERVRINKIRVGDDIRHNGDWYEIASVDHKTDDVSSLYHVQFTAGPPDAIYEDGDIVSRYLPTTDDAF